MNIIETIEAGKKAYDELQKNRLVPVSREEAHAFLDSLLLDVLVAVEGAMPEEKKYQMRADSETLYNVGWNNCRTAALTPLREAQEFIRNKK